MSQRSLKERRISCQRKEYLNEHSRFKECWINLVSEDKKRTQKADREIIIIKVSNDILMNFKFTLKQLWTTEKFLEDISFLTLLTQHIKKQRHPSVPRPTFQKCPWHIISRKKLTDVQIQSKHEYRSYYMPDSVQSKLHFLIHLIITIHL